jgi:hypothetical protein
MDHDTFYHRPAAASLGFELGQFLQGHFVIRFIVERDSLAATRQFARCAQEQHDGARMGVTGTINQRCRIDWTLCKFDHFHAHPLSAADWRDEGHFGLLVDGGIGRDISGVNSPQGVWNHGSQCRDGRDKCSAHIVDGRIFAHFHCRLITAR